MQCTTFNLIRCDMFPINYKGTFSNNSQWIDLMKLYSLNTPFPYCYGSLLRFIKIFLSNFTLATFHFLFFEVNICTANNQMIDWLYVSWKSRYFHFSNDNWKRLLWNRVWFFFFIANFHPNFFQYIHRNCHNKCERGIWILLIKKTN